MKKNTIITLEDETKYILLDKVTKNSKKYFFAIKLDNKDNPTNEYEIFESEEKDNEKYMNTIIGEKREEIFLEFSSNYIEYIEENE